MSVPPLAASDAVLPIAGAAEPINGRRRVVVGRPLRRSIAAHWHADDDDAVHGEDGGDTPHTGIVTPPSLCGDPPPTRGMCASHARGRSLLMTPPMSATSSSAAVAMLTPSSSSAPPTSTSPQTAAGGGDGPPGCCDVSSSSCSSQPLRLMSMLIRTDSHNTNANTTSNISAGPCSTEGAVARHRRQHDDHGAHHRCNQASSSPPSMVESSPPLSYSAGGGRSACGVGLMGCSYRNGPSRHNHQLSPLSPGLPLMGGSSSNSAAVAVAMASSSSAAHSGIAEQKPSSNVVRPSSGGGCFSICNSPSSPAARAANADGGGVVSLVSGGGGLPRSSSATRLSPLSFASPRGGGGWSVPHMHHHNQNHHAHQPSSDRPHLGMAGTWSSSSSQQAAPVVSGSPTVFRSGRGGRGAGALPPPIVVGAAAKRRLPPLLLGSPSMVVAPQQPIPNGTPINAPARDEGERGGSGAVPPPIPPPIPVSMAPPPLDLPLLGIGTTNSLRGSRVNKDTAPSTPQQFLVLCGAPGGDGDGDGDADGATCYGGAPPPLSLYSTRNIEEEEEEEEEEEGDDIHRAVSSLSSSTAETAALEPPNAHAYTLSFIADVADDGDGVAGGAPANGINGYIGSGGALLATSAVIPMHPSDSDASGVRRASSLHPIHHESATRRATEGEVHAVAAVEVTRASTMGPVMLRRVTTASNDSANLTEGTPADAPSSGSSPSRRGGGGIRRATIGTTAAMTAAPRGSLVSKAAAAAIVATTATPDAASPTANVFSPRPLVRLVDHAHRHRSPPLSEESHSSMTSPSFGGGGVLSVSAAAGSDSLPSGCSPLTATATRPHRIGLRRVNHNANSNNSNSNSHRRSVASPLPMVSSPPASPSVSSSSTSGMPAFAAFPLAAFVSTASMAIGEAPALRRNMNVTALQERLAMGGGGVGAVGVGGCLSLGTVGSSSSYFAPPPFRQQQGVEAPIFGIVADGGVSTHGSTNGSLVGSGVDVDDGAVAAQLAEALDDYISNREHRRITMVTAAAVAVAPNSPTTVTGGRAEGGGGDDAAKSGELSAVASIAGASVAADVLAALSQPSHRPMTASDVDAFDALFGLRI